MDSDTLRQIRQSERRSHEEIYASRELYQVGSWLNKPVKTVADILPLFEQYNELNVLDLGCGVGRNSIFIARQFRHIPCHIDCVDLLELAIEKLDGYAAQFGVSDSVRGIHAAIEDHPIRGSHYDLILAVSALEHIDSWESFQRKLEEIRKGLRPGGIVCLIVNSGVTETDKATGQPLTPQFEVNLPTEELQEILSQAFPRWSVLKSSVRHQRYDIPRETGISTLNTNVVTFVAQYR